VVTTSDLNTWGLRKYDVVANANANVITARKGPRIRSAGKPRINATNAATSPPARRQTKK